MLAHLGTMLVPILFLLMFLLSSGYPCFCSRCLRGCCAVELVDVVGAILCGASRNMLVCSVCCFAARTVNA